MGQTHNNMSENFVHHTASMIEMWYDFHAWELGLDHRTNVKTVFPNMNIVSKKDPVLHGR